MNLDELVLKDAEKLTPENLEDYRRTWAKKLKKMPKNSEIRPLLSDPELVEMMKTRGVRTESGVAPFAVMMKPFHCPGTCIYCPLEEGMPKSYLSDEPAAQRAKTLNFDPYEQVVGRLGQLKETGHLTNKIDLIVIGGTFSAYPDDYKREFFKGMYDGVNGFVSGSLEEAIKFNETAQRRIVGISVETRPDWVSEEEIKIWRRMGVTKVQLGVQAFDDLIMRKIDRGHSLDEVAEATRMCRNTGLKICYHFMPNLPGSSPEKDVEMARIMFEDPRFMPDYLKVYPAMTIPGTQMHKMWERGEYVPYSEAELREVLLAIKAMTPEWCRIDRLVRDISKKWVAAGEASTNMRQILQAQLLSEGKKCRCIRCREVRGGIYSDKVEYVERERTTLGGREIFMSFENEDKLYSMLRLRLPEPGEKFLFTELEGAAIVREVHTYGQVERLEESEGVKTQHKGLGRTLMNIAEERAIREGFGRIAVISAVGTREYYKKLGYTLEGEYMIKDFGHEK